MAHHDIYLHYVLSDVCKVNTMYIGMTINIFPSFVIHVRESVSPEGDKFYSRKSWLIAIWQTPVARVS